MSKNTPKTRQNTHKIKIISQNYRKKTYDARLGAVAGRVEGPSDALAERICVANDLEVHGDGILAVLLDALGRLKKPKK